MSKNSVQADFNDLLEQYYAAWFRFHPETAVHVGVAGYEDRLTPFSDEEIGALISLNQKLISSLDELDFRQLNSDQQVDYTVLYGAVNTELHDLLERDWRYDMPQRYLPLEAIHQLLQRPVENMHQALKHRLQQVEEHLRCAKGYLSQRPQAIPVIWVDDAIQSAASGARYFRDLMHNPVVTSQFKNPARLQPLCDTAAHAMEEYEKFLRRDIKPEAEGSFACGEEHFNSLLNEWHCLDIDAQALYGFGENLFRQTQQQLQALCESLPGPDNIDEQLAIIRAQHPANQGEELMNAYRSRMQAAYNFVVQHDLLTVPTEQSLKVVETPAFMRHEIPFAAYDEPSYKDPQQRGHYYVTPVRSEGNLLEHNWASIDLTCVHEAFPGHHLQFVSANRNPRNSLARTIHSSATLYEGWALYCEDMMQEQGFLAQPEHQFMMLRDRLWRALRVMLDVELHTRGLSIDQAAQRMCRELGFDIDQARADLSWYSQCPTVPMSYATGWALIRALRELEEEKADFNLKQFHDRLLSVGSCALPLVIKYEFGEATWQAVHKKVFAAVSPNVA